MHVDNVGAICLCNNGGGKRMRHVDIRGFYIRDYVEDGVVKIVFVKSVNNKADPYTKNVDGNCYHGHHGSYLIKNGDGTVNG